MKVRAAVLREMGKPTPYAESKPIAIETLELDPPEKDELLIEIKAASLCHSDLSVIDGSRPRPLPMALGHEAAGIVKEVGENVTEYSIGDHVVCIFVPTCGNCTPCKEGRPALCENGAKSNTEGTLLNGGIRLHDGKERVNHHVGVSAFSEYVVVSKHSVVKVDKSIPFEQIALFGCAVITGVGAVVNRAQVQFGSTVAVVGLGGVGLNAVLGAIASGAREVIAVDINDQKLQLAKKLGATSAYNSSEEGAIEKIKQATNGGLDYVFETAGVVPALEFAYQITKRGGTTVTSGLPHPDHHLSIQSVTLAAEERTLKGSYLGSCVPTRDIPRYIEMFEQGKLPVDQLGFDFITLDEINEGFDRLLKGEHARIIIKM